MDSAIGRSKYAPSFFISAGARLTTILTFGILKPHFAIADLMRSFDSRTEASGSPTISRLGYPRPTDDSTFIV